MGRLVRNNVKWCNENHHNYTDLRCAAHRVAHFGSKHLLVLAVLALQAVDVTLHLEDGVCDEGLP